MRSLRSRQAARRRWGIYLLVLVSWAAVVGIFTLLGITICSSLVFQPGFLYALLNFIAEYLLLVVIVSVLAGWVVISYYFIARPVRDLELLLLGAEELVHASESPIRLPDTLKGAEDQLNLLRERALRDAYATREAEQRKNDLVVYLAHDLKTPLTSIIGYLTLLRDEPDLSPAQRTRYTGVALEKAERLEDLVNEFFDITRFRLSHLELERRKVDLKRMLEQVCSEFEPVLQEKGMHCVLSLPPHLFAVCDADKLARVFDNLLNNACHYGYPGATIHVAGQEEEGMIVLTFRNAGPTIPADKLERMFEQFFRLDPSRGSGTGNAGLGLAIAKEIVEAHGGTIRAQSADEEVTFTVTLPAPAQA